MLVLSRRVGECILIGEDIWIEIVDVKGANRVSIGISAPKEIMILREENVSKKIPSPKVGGDGEVK